VLSELQNRLHFFGVNPFIETVSVSALRKHSEFEPFTWDSLHLRQLTTLGLLKAHLFDSPARMVVERYNIKGSLLLSARLVISLDTVRELPFTESQRRERILSLCHDHRVFDK